MDEIKTFDFGQYTYPPCQCPITWWGVTRPPCPVHNPGMPYTVTTFPSLPPAQAPIPTISDADVDRIARRVAELLKVAP